MSVVVKCHPGVAVVAVYHGYPVGLVSLKTVSLVTLTTALIKRTLKVIENREGGLSHLGLANYRQIR